MCNMCNPDHTVVFHWWKYIQASMSCEFQERPMPLCLIQGETFFLCVISSFFFLMVLYVCLCFV